jgi:hypothetical protein
MGNTFRLLNTLHDLKSLKDEVIDGVSCYHYQGIFDMSDPVSARSVIINIWVGKDDNLPRKETFGDSYSILYTDLNQPLAIEAPLTPAGELQPGWHMLQAGPHLTANYSNSIGGADMTHPVFEFDISLYNDGLDEAKDVHVVLQTMATNNAVKPAQLEATPVDGNSPVNISSWQMVEFKIQWEFDAGDMAKMDLFQLMQQTTFTVTYHTPDGTVITDTYPKTISQLPK